MKVNNFNFFSLGSQKLVKLLSLVAVVFMLSASDASAQYVAKDEAISRLENQIIVISQTAGFPNLVPNSTVTLVLYYKEIISQLTSNTPDVGQALRDAIRHFKSGSAPIFSTANIVNHPVITKNELNNMQTAAIQLLSI